MGVAAPQDDGEGATRLRKNAISCSVAQLGAMENLAAQVFPQACRRNANTKHMKDRIWVWLRHGLEFRSLRSLEFWVLGSASRWQSCGVAAFFVDLVYFVV